MKTLEKVVGWFVEPEEPEPAPVVATVVTAAPRPAAPPRTFAEVYEAASIGRDDRDRVDRALELLATLPDSTPIEVRRSIVEASMRAFGVPLEGMLATVDAEIAALDRHAQQRAEERENAEIRARARIEALEAEISELRAILAAEVHARDGLATETEVEKRRVSALRSFFAR